METKSEKEQEILAAGEAYSNAKTGLDKAIKDYNQAKAKLETLEITVGGNPLEKLAARIPETFTTGQILTISARDYCESRGKPLSHYQMVGVHCDDIYSSPEEALAALAKRAPKNTEVIVGYTVALSVEHLVASGTALILTYPGAMLDMLEGKCPRTVPLSPSKETTLLVQEYTGDYEETTI